MALALRPKILILDEPTTALDTVAQREILQEIYELKKVLHFSILFITHDLSLMMEFCDSVAIMYAGKFIEQASTKDIMKAPKHPYTYGLKHSFPSLQGKIEYMEGIPGTPLDLKHIPNMSKMKKELGKSFLYITHDIATARYFSDRITVLYNGHMVEWGNVDDVVQNPKHPYTKLLISAAPDPDHTTQREVQSKKGVERKSWTPQSRGCPFISFCKTATKECKTYLAEPQEIGHNRFVRCNHV